MQTIIRSLILTLCALLFIGCATRIPVNKPAELIWWVGKRVKMKRAFNLVPNYAGRDAVAWKGSTAYVGENYPLQIKPGQLCEVIRFYRLTEGEGSKVIAVLRTPVAGTLRDFEYMFLPDGNTPGRNQAEMVARELTDKSINRAWTLAE